MWGHLRSAVGRDILWQKVKNAALEWPFETMFAASMIISPIISTVVLQFPTPLIGHEIGPRSAALWSIFSLLVGLVLFRSLLKDDLRGTMYSLLAAGGLLTGYIAVAFISPADNLSVLGLTFEAVVVFTAITRAWYMHAVDKGYKCTRER